MLESESVFGRYALLLVLLVGGQLRRFLKTPFVLLGIALTLFVAAIVVDALPKTPFGWMPGIEDLFEMIGIFFWSIYFLKCSRDGINERLTASA